MSGERLMGVAASAVGLIALAETFRLPVDTLTGGPGSRFLPAALGVIVLVLGAAVALRRPGLTPGDAAVDPGWVWRLAGTLLGLIAYALFFERLGFLVSTTAFLVVTLVGYGERRWYMVVALTAGATAATYAVFVLWLRVPLPRGVLGP